jgi:toxin YhaV
VFAWVNDEQTLRSSGSKSDPYAVFEKRLNRGNPPDNWAALMAASEKNWTNPKEKTE